MTSEVMRAIAEGAVKTAMSIEPMVMKSSDVGAIALAFACVALAMSVMAMAFASVK